MKPNVLPVVALATLGLMGQAPSLRQFTLPDPFLRMTAWTFLAPEGWAMEGGVSWTGRSNPWYNTVLSVRNPRGSEEFRRFPVFMFAQTQNLGLANGAELAPVMNPAEALQRVILPRCRPEIRQPRIVAVEPLPKLAEVTVNEARGFGLALLQVATVRMLVEYSLNGRPMEEMFYCTTAAFQNHGLITWMTDKAFSYRAEKGKLKAAFPVLGTVAASLRESPQWVSARRQEMARMVAAATRPPQTSSGGGLSILDVSRSMSKNQDHFLKGLDASFSARLNSPSSQAWSDAYRGTTTMQTSTGTNVSVSNGYQRYFQDNLGRVYGSDDVISDPYVNYHMNVTELHR